MNSSAEDEQTANIRQKIIGLGETSIRKSHYPELQQRLVELEHEIEERRQAEQRLSTQLERLDVLHQIDGIITSPVELREKLCDILEITRIQLDMDAASLWRYDNSAGQLYSLYTWQITQAASLFLAAHPNMQPTSLNHLRRRATSGETILQTFRPPLEINHQTWHTYLAIPLQTSREVLGICEVFWQQPRQLDAEYIAFLHAIASQIAIAIQDAELLEGLRQSNLELQRTYDATLEGWAMALELREKETSQHTYRVTQMTVVLARFMGLTPEQLVHIRRGALLHDIGKMAIPDHVLLKPGPLNDEEREIMRKHPEYALNMLESIPFLERAIEIPYAHHERWDGSGYPRRLQGTAIPAAARLFAVVDVWDALLSDRPYRKAWAEEKTLRYLREQSGILFDPQAVTAFLQVLQNYDRQALQFEKR